MAPNTQCVFSSGQCDSAAPVPDVECWAFVLWCGFVILVVLMGCLRELTGCAFSDIKRMLTTLQKLVGVSVSEELREQLDVHQAEADWWFMKIGTGLLRCVVMARAPMRLLAALETGRSPLPMTFFVPMTSFVLAIIFYGQQGMFTAKHTAKLWLLVVAMYFVLKDVRLEHDANVFIAITRVGVLFVLPPESNIPLNGVVSALRIANIVAHMESTIVGTQMMCQEVCFWVGSMLVGLGIRQLQITSAQHALSAIHLERQNKATDHVLCSRTDATLTLDGDLRIVNPTRQLVAMLGAQADDLRGLAFSSFLPLKEDRLRFEKMCNTENMQDEDLSIVDSLHVALQNHSKSLTFNSQLFHVPFHNSGGVSHRLGLCKCKRAEATEQPVQETLPPAPQQTLNLPRQARPAARSSRSKSSRSSRSSTRASDTGDGLVRVVVDALTESLAFVEGSDGFAEFCDPEEGASVQDALDKKSVVRIQVWLQQLVNRALESWAPGEFVRVKWVTRLRLTSRYDNQDYSFLLTATLPDPIIAVTEDFGYQVTLCFEMKQQVGPTPLTAEALSSLPEQSE